MAVGTVAAIGLGLSAFGTGMSAYSQFRAGKDAEKLAMLGTPGGGGGGMDPAVAEALAQDAEKRGALEEQQLRARIRYGLGQQRAGYASQNVDVRVGSPVDVAADTAYQGELDAQTIRANTAREAWGYRANLGGGGGGGTPGRPSGYGTAGLFNAIGTGIQGAVGLIDAYTRLRVPASSPSILTSHQTVPTSTTWMPPATGGAR